MPLTCARFSIHDIGVQPPYATLLASCLAFGCLSADTATDDRPDASQPDEAEQALLDDSMEPDENTRLIVERHTRFRVAPGVALLESAEREARELRFRHAFALQQSYPLEELLARSEPADVMTVEYLGLGAVTPESEDAEGEFTVVSEDDPEPEIPDELMDGATWLDGFSVSTGNVFRLRIPQDHAAAVHELAFAQGLNLGEGDEDVAADDDGGGHVPRHNPTGTDTRSMIGSVNTAHNNAFARMIHFSGGCSGVLFGPKHTITAAHCIYNWTGANMGSWLGHTLRAGRNGTAWHTSIAYNINANIWVWTPSQYRSAGSNPRVGAWDIGAVVTHDNRMGEDPDVNGWFGWLWAYNNTFEGYTKYNRGYPSCATGASHACPPCTSFVTECSTTCSPTGCNSSHLYGDTLLCSVGNYDGGQDSGGIFRRFKHSCDGNEGASGSPVYRLEGSSRNVVGVYTGWDNGSGTRPYFGTRITQDYSAQLSWLRSTFP